MFNSRSALALAGGGANSQEVTQLKQQVQQQQALIDSLQKATQVRQFPPISGFVWAVSFS